jgi:hypothetical protein
VVEPLVMANAGAADDDRRAVSDRPAAAAADREIERLFAGAEADFANYEMIKDLVDELIDLSLDYRQSGHPGGSRSKVHMLLALLLSGAMRWDIRRPWLRFGDRFVLSAGHTVPLVYATLAVLNEALRARFERTGDPRFAFPEDGRFALTWEQPARVAASRRAAGPRRDGRADALLQGKHGTVGPRHAFRRRRSAGSQASRRRTRSRSSSSRARAV